MKSMMIVLMMLGLMVAGANAGVINAQALTGAGDVLTDGTLVTAVNLGELATTVNGVAFAAADGTGFTVDQTPESTATGLVVNSRNWAVGTLFTGTPGGTDAFDVMMNSMVWAGCSGNPTGVMLHFSLTGLTDGEDYRLQMFMGEGRDYNHPITVTAGDTTSEIFGYGSREGALGEGVRADVYFTADATGTMDITITGMQDSWDNGFGGPSFNAYVLSSGVEPVSDKAFNPTPKNGVTIDKVDVTALAWETPTTYSADNYVIEFREGTEATEPNWLSETTSIVDNGTSTTAALPIALDYEKTYYWRVTAYEPNYVGTQISTPHVGSAWSFTTIASDSIPVVTPGSSYITWLDALDQTLTGTVEDFGDADISNDSVVWSILDYSGSISNSAARMIRRADDNANLLELAAAGEDPDFLKDWIAVDKRNEGSPLVLVLGDLPAGSYTWISTHHDVQAQTGLFDVTVDNGTTVSSPETVDVSDNASVPTIYATSFTADGTNPVKLIFDAQDDTDGGLSFTVMNGFELTDGINRLMIDFSRAADVNDISPDYEGYLASDFTPSSFTEQSFAFGTATVTVDAEFGPVAAGWASVTKTSTDPLNPTATFTTNAPGTYTIQLTATDISGQADSKTLTVKVAEDACGAAQLTSQFIFSSHDYDQNCIVDLADFASFALQWLNDVSLDAPEAY